MASTSRQNAWQNSIWSCWSPFPLCLKVTFCPCMVSGHIHHRLRGGTEETYSAFANSWCWGYVGLILCGGCNCFLQYADREEVRQRFNLEGDATKSFIYAAGLPCCDLVQIEKELDHHHAQMSQALNAPPAGYRRNEEMVAVGGGQNSGTV